MKLSDLSEPQYRRYYETRLRDYSMKKQRIGYMARCCFHEDKTPSLSINTSAGVWNCFAGCGSGGVLAFEMKLSGCDEGTAVAHIAEIIGEKQLMLGQKPEAIYVYVDADGREYFQVLRWPGKKIQQRRRDEKGGWIWETKDLKMCLYHLDRVVQASEVCITEGEKDADNLYALLRPHSPSNSTLACTTNPRGAGRWEDSFAPFFSGKRTVIFQDNDEAGEKHALSVASSIYRFAQGVKICKPAVGKDISDWIASGATAKDVARLVKDTPTWFPQAANGGLFMTVTEFEANSANQIDWLVEGVIQKGANGLLIARPKAGKSFAVLDLALALASGQRWLDFHIANRARVALVSREDNPGLTQWRIKKLRAERLLTQADLDSWLYVNAKGLKPKIMLDIPEDVKALIEELQRQGTEFLILDVMRSLHNLDENDNTDMQKIVVTLNEIQEKVGCSICLIHHDNKREDATLTERARGASAIAGYAEFIAGIRVVDDKDWTREFECELKASMAPDKFHFRIVDTADNGIKLERVEWSPPEPPRRRRKDSPQESKNEEIPF